MNIKTVKNIDLNPKVWSKGSTSEYFIYPESADYSNKDFLFRISSATIDEVPAVFTKFDGYLRYLVMLDSSIDLEINESRAVVAKHTIINFSSRNDVTSFSVGQDFNLMVNESIKSSYVQIQKGLVTSNSSFFIAFALSPCSILVNNKKYELNSYDCIIIENTSLSLLNVSCDSNFIAASINL